MNARTTWFLLLLALALGAYILGVDRFRDNSTQQAEKARRVVTFTPAAITQIDLQGPGVKLALTRAAGGWRMNAPIQAEADESRVEGLLERLAALPRSQFITEGQIRRSGLTDRDYGLDQPRWTVRLASRERELTLSIGRDAPSGDALYLRYAGTKGVMASPTNLLAELPATVEDYRNRQLVSGQPSDIVRLSLRSRAGYVEVVRAEAGEWSMVKPVGARADAAVVGAALRALHAARIVDFEPASRVGASLYGLDEPAVRCTLAARDGSPERAILIGKTVESDTNRVYAARDEIDEVYTIDRALLSSLMLAPEDIRDHSLLPVSPSSVTSIRLAAGEAVIELTRTSGTWRTTAPLSMPADTRKIQLALAEWSGARIRSFIDLPPTNAPRATGLGTDVVRSIAFQAPGVPGIPAVTGLVFEIVATNEGLPVVRTPDRADTLFRLDAATLQALPQDLLYYRDRAIQMLFTNSVRSIVITRGTQSATLQPAATNAATDPRVAPLLQTLGALQAREFVTADTGDLSRFGLDEPHATIVLVAAGESGLARALRIGTALPDGARYAMTQAEELVFVLDARTVARLLEPLGTAPP